MPPVIWQYSVRGRDQIRSGAAEGSAERMLCFSSRHVFSVFLPLPEPSPPFPPLLPSRSTQSERIPRSHTVPMPRQSAVEALYLTDAESNKIILIALTMAFCGLLTLFCYKGGRYSSPPSPPETQRESSSETMSPVYPDRPIKPLPKRRLKDRLSSEAAETISYPPAPAASGAMFYPSPSYDTNASQHQKNMQNGTVSDVDRALIDAQSGGYPAKDVPYEFHGTDPVSDDENGVSARQDGYRSHAIRPQSHSVASSGESADGYESFENTNNKKKRKIPTSAGSGLMHPALPNSLSADLANMGISSAGEGPEGDEGIAKYYGSSDRVPGNGISGPGRGRYGRNGRRDTRSPLGASANASNAWQTGRMPGPRHSSGKYASKQAAASPLALDKGQENISLLEQQQRAARKNTPAAQFTFNMDSEASKGPAWPGDQYGSPVGHLPPQQHMPPPHGNGYAQTSPAMAGQGQRGGPPAQQPAPPPRPHRTPAQRYARAARQRKMDQEYENLRKPNADIWICEFCEYESIFGRPPRALIRQYEMKDEHERKRQKEKQRLLEKAKSKGRKARKGTKASKANAAAAAAAAANAPAGGAAPANSQQYPQQGYPQHGQPPLDHGEDYYSGEGDAGYEDDPPISTLGPATPSKIPAPTQQYGANPRPADRQGYAAGPGPGGTPHQQQHPADVAA